MKKNVLILFSLILASSICIGLLVADISDPSGTFEQILSLRAAYHDQAEAAIDNAPMDYHPDYGVVGVGDYMMNPNGWDNSQVASLFPGEVVLNYCITTELFTGRAFVQHMATDGTIFGVWHDLVDETMVTVSATVHDGSGGRARGEIRKVLERCSNGLVLVEDEHGDEYWVNPSEVPAGL